MDKFNCFSLSPIELEHPGLAIASIRAGGIGILDREFCQPENLERAISNLEQVLALKNAPGAAGLRLNLTQIEQSGQLLARLELESHWLILSGWQEATAETLREKLQLLSGENRLILLEITDANQLALLASLFPFLAGLVAKGQESGGWVGEDPAFILTQKLLKTSSLPIYVQGGIGIHTAAACRAAGAAGVVLDDQLWLMPESPLPGEWQEYLRYLNGQEAIAIGERLGRACRVLSRPGFAAVAKLQEMAAQIEIQEETSVSGQIWRQRATSLIGWENPATQAWPMGQASGLAADFRKRYQTTGKFLQALLKGSQEQVQTAQELKPLQAETPLAVSHGTKYPIVQGPMTRVSDTAEFAHAVARSGGLPLLALALMRGKQVGELLQKTQALLGELPWGIGILGFVPQAIREEQLQEVQKIKPPFALIAGGRPDQAARLEAQGIATYLHVPVPALLKMFLEQGARRFIFEGRECGGHVGPLSSFVLWESMIATLLEKVPAGAEQQIHAIFAGGIHDALSAAMISAMATPLAVRGMKIGVLMGSAYLFTEEAVACGAILPEFQAQALSCQSTINLETGPGHASRCAVTPFAREFYDTRRQMAARGSSAEEIKNVLEDLTLGRLRIATKGLRRDETGQIVSVNQEQQVSEGMYMIGQVATMRHQVISVSSLHQEVAEGSGQLLTSLSPAGEKKVPTPTPPSDIAIVGMATLVPKADAPETFWKNILSRVKAIGEIPAHRWDWRLYYDADPQTRDKVYSKWGGFIDEVPFDPLRFGIPPVSLKSIEPLQLLTLEAVRRALEDAGYGGGDFDRERTSVILGAGGGIGDLGGQYAARAEVPRVVENPSPQIWDRLPEWTEETFPGLLLNVAAGRVANRFNCGGSNFTVDAACASSLAAIDLAVTELETGRSNLCIAGGIDTGQSPFAYFCFSKTHALSAQGQPRSFDKAADGIVISEGIAIVVLKRLADAERDGDRIYAVIKAVAGSSDGKALGLTAPLPAGQKRALQRAYEKAGFSPASLGLYEAHGTGTVAGDRAELETITSSLQASGAGQKSCAIGSIKTLLGHTKSAAGVVGLIKVALSLHHQVLPAHFGVDTPLDPIVDPESPVYLLKDNHPWLTNPNQPRRGGVSAFGFGGTNFHAILEEYGGAVQRPALGGDDWPWELVILAAENRQELMPKVRFLLTALQGGAKPQLGDLAYSCALTATNHLGRGATLAIVTSNLSELIASLARSLSYLAGDSASPLPPEIQFSEGHTPTGTKALTAFLFPGQGAQYPGMAREVALYRQEMRQALEFADSHLGHHFPKLLSQYIYPPSAYSEAAEISNEQQLKQTQVAQPALGAVESGYLALLANLGIKADLAAGHSYGEYTALYAAGVLSQAQFLNLSALRGQIMSQACQGVEGAMAAVQITREELAQYLDSFPGVVVANHNAPLQSVISGPQAAIEQAINSLNADGITARKLPVAGAFHSPLLAEVQEELTRQLNSGCFESPQFPVYANATALPYPSDADGIRGQLSQQALRPVEFVSQIQALYEAGARTFIEVGPKSILTKFVGQILGDKEHTCVSLDGQGGGLRGFLLGLGTLITRGLEVQLLSLFVGRQVQQLQLSRLAELTSPSQLAPTTWLVNGGGVRSLGATNSYSGKLPPLSWATSILGRQDKKGQNGNTEAKPDLGIERFEPVKPPSPAPHAHSPSQLTGLNPIVPTNSNPQPKIQRTMSEQNFPPLSQPATPQTYSTSQEPSVAGSVALQAYQAYQQTMRQFLTLQEKVMLQFLQASQVEGMTPSRSVAMPERSLPAAQPVLSLGSNGGGSANLSPASPPVPPRISPPPSRPAAPPQISVSPTSVSPTIEQQEPVLKPQPAAASPNLPTAADAVVPSVLLERESVTKTLLQLVSERTGYPIDMLGLDQDLEAELGIDSIKRVEILGAIQKSLPAAVAEGMQSQMENLTKVKSLNGIVQQVLCLSPSGTVEPSKSLGKF